MTTTNMDKKNSTHNYRPHSPSGLQHPKPGVVISLYDLRQNRDNYEFQQLKRKPPEKKSDLISVRVPSTLKDHLQAMADTQQRSLSWLTWKILQHYYDHGLMEEIFGRESK